MPTVEVSLPDRIDSRIDRLVDQGEFLNRDQAVEELLSRGISTYGEVEESTNELSEDLFTQAIDEQQDPAMQDGSDDTGYTF